MEKLVPHFGKTHATSGACVSAVDTKREWDGVKDIMFTVRRLPAIANKITTLAVQEKKRRPTKLKDVGMKMRPRWIRENARC